MSNEIIDILERGFRELSPPDTGDNSWVVEWVLKRKGQIESTRQAIKNRYKEIMDDLNKEEAGIDLYYGPAVQTESDKLIWKQRGKKKSAKLLTGTVGYREQPEKLVIVDTEAAKLWALANLPPDAFEAAAGTLDKAKIIRDYLTLIQLCDCITSLNVTPFSDFWKSKGKETGEVPDGCDVVAAEEKFFAKPVELKLPERTKDGI